MPSAQTASLSLDGLSPAKLSQASWISGFLESINSWTYRLFIHLFLYLLIYTTNIMNLLYNMQYGYLKLKRTQPELSKSSQSYLRDRDVGNIFYINNFCKSYHNKGTFKALWGHTGGSADSEEVKQVDVDPCWV